MPLREEQLLTTIFLVQYIHNMFADVRNKSEPSKTNEFHKHDTWTSLSENWYCLKPITKVKEYNKKKWCHHIENTLFSAWEVKIFVWHYQCVKKCINEDPATISKFIPKLDSRSRIFYKILSVEQFISCLHFSPFQPQQIFWHRYSILKSIFQPVPPLSSPLWPSKVSPKVLILHSKLPHVQKPIFHLVKLIYQVKNSYTSEQLNNKEHLPQCYEMCIQPDCTDA